MKFGELTVDEAEGTILAHALSVEGKRYKKGRVLGKADLTDFKKAGIKTIIVAQLADDDVEENEAACLLSEAISSQHIVAQSAFTGRVNLHATSAGVFFASSDVVDAINRTDPTITLATLADGTFVEAGRMVATIKIIPFASPRRAVDQVVELAQHSRVFSLKRSKPKKVGLIATCLPTLKETTMDKTRGVLEQRLAAAGSWLVNEVRVLHHEEEVAQALSDMEPDCDLIIIFGASAICDANDVIPAGLIAAGGDVSHFGMPVDPGNLMLTGALGKTPVIGAPGCARSPAENGFDWVLQRLLADLEVTPEYITGLGVGGLLMEITTRPQPREG